MNDQLEFAGIIPPVKIRSADGRSDPVVWVRKLAIYRDWPLNEASKLRVLDLHRGLNILWARPTAPNRRERRPQAKISGHATGKTTFSRLVRFILGDANFGNDRFREAFRARFRNGWAMGEVIVRGKCWLVGRPMGEVGYHRFAIPDAVLDATLNRPDIPRGGFEDYLAAIDDAVLGDIGTRSLATPRSELKWEHVLQWLTRDQEARFSDLLGWRARASQAEYEDLVQVDKENLIRVMLGFATREERRLIQDYNAAAERHRAAIGERTKLAYQVAVDNQRVATLAQIDPGPATDALSGTIIDRRLEVMREKSRALAAAVTSELAIEEVRKKLAELEAGTAIARERKREIEAVLESARAQLEADEGKVVAETRLQAFRNYRPFRGHCSHPLNEAWKAECPLADKRGSDAEFDQQVAGLRSKAEFTRWEISNLDRDLSERQGVLNACVIAEAPVIRELQELKTRRESTALVAQNAENRIRAVEQLRANLTEARARQEANERVIVESQVDKERADELLVRCKEQHVVQLGDFSRLYDFVVRELLCEAVAASVTIAGKGIEPAVNYHGRLDSAALETVRLLAFDIASMLGSILGQGHHPRFLLHDSPREADLSQGIYQSLFDLIVRLENECGGHDSAPFQYIITTTEPAPEELNRPPWLLEPVLDASRPETRLLGIDL